jgi:hypothetical protein
MNSEDPRRRPVVLHSGPRGDEPQPRSRRYLAWAGTGLAGLVAAAGLIAGGTAVWSAFDPGTPGRSPAPLWFTPPETIAPQSEVTPTADDHGGDRTGTPPTTTIEPGDDKGGDRTRPTSSPSGTATSGPSGTATSRKHGSDDPGKSGSGKSGSGESGSGESGSGTDDGSNHR